MASNGGRYVSQYEYDNAMRQKREAEARRARADAELEQAQVRLENAQNDLARRTGFDKRQLQEALQDEEEKLLKGLDSTTLELRRAIGQQNVALRKQLDEVRGEVSEMHREIKSAQEDVDQAKRAVDALDKRVTEVAKQFDQNLRKIADRLAGERDRAQYYSNAFSLLVEHIDALHPDKLTPGKAELLHDTQSFLAVNIKNGDYQAAIGLAQSNIPDAVTLQSELERLNDEFDRLAVAVRRQLLDIRQIIQRLSDPGANSRDIEIGRGDSVYEFTFNGDVGYWTSGVFSKLTSKFDDEQRLIEDTYISEMDLENLRLAIKALPAYHARFDRCLAFALEEFEMSGRIQVTAMKVLEALTHDGSWTLTGSGFENEDVRLSYSELFTDGKGNRAAVVISPEKPSNRRGHEADAPIALEACDGETCISETMCGILRSAIEARLRSGGLEVSTDAKGRAAPQHASSERFVDAAYRVGSKAKDERIGAVQNQLRI